MNTVDTAKELFRQLLTKCVDVKGSDLHLSANCLPIVRIHGHLQSVDDRILEQEQIALMLQTILSPRQQAVFKEERTLDLAISLDQSSRFRVNIYQERGQTAIAIRRLENKILTLSELGLPRQLEELTTMKDGLILFTGPTGSGKSTSLAALLHRINLTQTCHILTIEDPIEYLHFNEKSLIHQRELHTDVDSFSGALRAALREDPDVILVEEMRDLATMRAALTAAETGHLVFSTLHCGDTVGALDRILAMYPPVEQQAVRQQLAMTLKVVVAQRLLQRIDNGGRVPAVEILHVNNAVGNLIRTAQFPQIYSILETGSNNGMQSLDVALAELVRCKQVARARAAGLTRNNQLFSERLTIRNKPPRVGVY